LIKSLIIWQKDRDWV